MKIDIMTLFPALIDSVMNESVIGRAQARGLIEVRAHNIRDWAFDKHHKADDSPYGGGRGMVMLAEPLYLCHQAISGGEHVHTVLMSAQGAPFCQQKARELLERGRFILVCGHYEGVDQRFIDECVDEEISIGDFVLTGGEIPAMAVADAVCRMAPGVLPDETAFQEESHWDGLLEHPQYTRPEVWRGRAAPEVLLSGHHANIVRWRRKMSLRRTRDDRPDLFAEFVPRDKADRRILDELAQEAANASQPEERCLQPALTTSPEHEPASTVLKEAPQGQETVSAEPAGTERAGVEHVPAPTAPTETQAAEKNRCPWAGDLPIYIAYHDNEWGRPVHDSRKLFEMLLLESMQAGLSWITILKKREAFRAAFDGFDPVKIACYDEEKIASLMADPGIVRNRRKIDAAIGNAKAFLTLEERPGGFDRFLWDYVDGVPLVGGWDTIEQMPASTPLSDQISKDLKKLGFRFVGTVIVYSFLQAVGVVNDHLKTCCVYEEIVQKYGGRPL